MILKVKPGVVAVKTMIEMGIIEGKDSVITMLAKAMRLLCHANDTYC